MRTFLIGILALTTSLVAGCDSGAVCLDEIRPAIVVEVRDATTGVFIAEIASGAIVDRGYSDEFAPHAYDEQGVLRSLFAGEGQAGIFFVFLEAPGYVTWEREAVMVQEDRCGVVTTSLVADMQSL